MCKLYPMAPRDPVERYFRARVPETNNARSETAASRPTYRAAWAAGQRCLIPAAWYQEPNWETGRNVWRRMTRAGGEPWAIAGLWSEWTDPATGEMVPNFTILGAPTVTQ